ncbi:TetR/AcrR family transcriptional regulator [Actinoallomurus acaciae]|uniref:TetR/AcrR family transcriptional regulator n=1 Tax=Actinoallomurus acaciae TaxID=502577 RepID=A0ABV5YU37_9ACTN
MSSSVGPVSRRIPGRLGGRLNVAASGAWRHGCATARRVFPNAFPHVSEYGATGRTSPSVSCGHGAGVGKTRRRATAQDRVDAALAAIGEGGLSAVAVEPLAKRLSGTKGSFHSHFANREGRAGTLGKAQHRRRHRRGRRRVRSGAEAAKSLQDGARGGHR